jgi:hypothetical protein
LASLWFFCLSIIINISHFELCWWWWRTDRQTTVMAIAYIFLWTRWAKHLGIIQTSILKNPAIVLSYNKYKVYRVMYVTSLTLLTWSKRKYKLLASLWFFCLSIIINISHFYYLPLACWNQTLQEWCFWGPLQKLLIVMIRQCQWAYIHHSIDFIFIITQNNGILNSYHDHLDQVS